MSAEGAERNQNFEQNWTRLILQLQNLDKVDFTIEEQSGRGRKITREYLDVIILRNYIPEKTLRYLKLK